MTTDLLGCCLFCGHAGKWHAEGIRSDRGKGPVPVRICLLQGCKCAEER